MSEYQIIKDVNQLKIYVRINSLWLFWIFYSNQFYVKTGLLDL